MSSAADLSVVKIVAELIAAQPEGFVVTPSSIETLVLDTISMHPGWKDKVDQQYVNEELIRRFSVTVGKDKTIVNREGHVAWLTSERSRNWMYWGRYREFLERKLPLTAVEGLDRSTANIIGMLEDPTREGIWDRRGMVVGHVQSGKTASYTGLICKAADAGYKVIVVLAGLHNNLRSQTQIRIEEGFLGYTTPQETSESIGVGLLDRLPRPNCPTIRTEKGDFNAAIARNLAISPEDRPWIFVVKKNKSVLTKLCRWIETRVSDSEVDGRKVVSTLPLLVIDDEADHASVDTGELIFDGEGNPDPDHEPTAINRLVRKLLNSFQRSAYVGYTATPFANIFIHERSATRSEGPDLFPSAFIQTLSTPSNYVGPSTLFGRRIGDSRVGMAPLLRKVDDATDGPSTPTPWMPIRHDKDHVPSSHGDDLPESLKSAVLSFLIACAVRYLRGQRNEHMSMLVHVTRFNAVQKIVYAQVESYVTHVRQILLRRTAGYEQLLTYLDFLWSSDFVPTSGAMSKSTNFPGLHSLPAWDDVLDIMTDVLTDLSIRTINGTAKDTLDYAEHEKTGLKAIAIGGDKLARGLTLEGLMVSYFLRASKMYDTLMQMGRWFGYRPGYLDLTRLYTTEELVEWFEHITDASEELRDEFDVMEASGATPRQYGLRVQAHPVLLVTSRLKMRSAHDLKISYSGEIVETVAFHSDAEKVRHNFSALCEFLGALGTGSLNPVQSRPGGKVREWNGTTYWDSVSAQNVSEFLRMYSSHPDSYKTDTVRIAEFIEKMALTGELQFWNVALLGGGEGEAVKLNQQLSTNSFVRSQRGTSVGKVSISRLLSPTDEAIDIGVEVWSRALDRTREIWRRSVSDRRSVIEPDVPSGIAIRVEKGESNIRTGLLLIYLIDPRASGMNLNADAPLVGIGISFPGSKSDVRVSYKINSVAFNQQYGPSE